MQTLPLLNTQINASLKARLTSCARRHTGWRFLGCGLGMLWLSACASIDEGAIDYKTARAGRGLEVPPDLVQLAPEVRYQRAASGVVSASELSQAQHNSATGAQGAMQVAALKIGDAELKTDGKLRWLHIRRSPDALWVPVRDFWLQNGFLLSSDNAKVGVMETDWAENRAKIPMDIIRATLGKLLDSIYSTAERDRFRVRIEPSPEGGSDLYLTHRGMVEEFTADKTSTVFVPRASDPFLESEFMRRIMVYLGSTEEHSKAVIAKGAARQGEAAVAAKIEHRDGQASIVLNAAQDRAWRLLSLSLDRLGFTVEDRNNSAGTFLVRYADPAKEGQKPGFLGRLFGGSQTTTDVQRYQVKLSPAGASQSTVQLLTLEGAPASGKAAGQILNILTDDLR